jgi:hypothetical protein
VHRLHSLPASRRHYEHECLDSAYRRAAMPAAVAQRLADARSALIACVVDFFHQLQGGGGASESITLRFHDSCSRLSFFSAKSAAKQLERFTQGAIALEPFEGQLPVASMRAKCFVTDALATAEVCTSVSVQPRQCDDLACAGHLRHKPTSGHQG